MTEKPPSLRHRLEYLAVITVVAGVRLMPMPVVLAVGWLIGRAFYWFDGPHRRRAMRNLHAAFPLRSRSECRAIARRMFSHFGRLLTVFLKFSTMTPQQMLARVSFEGEERVRAAHAQEGRAALHRAFRLLGDQRARARGRAQADVGARAPARQPAAPSVARIDAAEDRQRRDLPARRDSARAARARIERGRRGADRSAHSYR